jgi:hypothetical protein
MYAAHIEDFVIKASSAADFNKLGLSHNDESEATLGEWVRHSKTELDAQTDAGEHGNTFRDEGMVLAANLIYSNTDSKEPLLVWLLAEWGLVAAPSFISGYKVKRIPKEEYKQTQIKWMSDDGHSRRLWKRHGVFLQFKAVLASVLMVHA